MQIALLSILALLLSIFLSFLVLRFFPRFGLLDNPEKYGHKRKPIPLSGGIVIPIVFSLLAIIFLPFTKQLFALVIGSLFLSIVSFWDDRKNISPILRLSFQIFLALFIISMGIGIEVISNPLGRHIILNTYQIDIPIKGIDYQITVLADLFTLIWIVVMINTMNWLDGVVGLSAGTAVAGGIALGVLSLTPLVNQPEIATLSFIFAFASLGFLIFNIHPPKMLLGDAGTMPLGFILAVLAIFSGGKVATAFLVLALPLLDTFWVIFSRILQKKAPWKGQDKAHLHDRLLMIGWSEREIFLLFFSSAIVLGISTLLIGTVGKGVLITMAFLVFIIFRLQIEKRTKDL